MEIETTDHGAQRSDVQMEDQAITEAYPCDLNDFNSDPDLDDMLVNFDLSQLQSDDLVSILEVLDSCPPQDSAAVQANNEFSCLPTAKSGTLVPAQEYSNTYLPPNPVAAQRGNDGLHQNSLLAASSNWQYSAPVDSTFDMAYNPAAAETANNGLHWNAVPQNKVGLLEPQDSAVVNVATGTNAVPVFTSVIEEGINLDPWSTNNDYSQLHASDDLGWVQQCHYPNPLGMMQCLPPSQFYYDSSANHASDRNFAAKSALGLQPPRLAPYPYHSGNQRPCYPYIPPPANLRHLEQLLSPWEEPALRSHPYPTMTGPLCYRSQKPYSAAPIHEFDAPGMQEVREPQGMQDYAQSCHQVPALFPRDEADTKDGHPTPRPQSCVCRCGNVHGMSSAAPRKPTGKKPPSTSRSVTQSYERKSYRVEKPREKALRNPRNRPQPYVQALRRLEEQDQAEGLSRNSSTTRSSGLVAPAQSLRNENPSTQRRAQPPQTRAQSRMQAERERKENEKNRKVTDTESEAETENDEDGDGDANDDDDKDKDYEDVTARSRVHSHLGPQPSMKAYEPDGVDGNDQLLSMAVRAPIRRFLHPGRSTQIKQTTAVLKRNLRRRERYRERLSPEQRRQYDLNAAKAKGLI